MNEQENGKKSLKQRFIDFWIPNKKDDRNHLIGKIVSLLAVVFILAAVVLLLLLWKKYGGAQSIVNTYSDLYSVNDSSVASEENSLPSPEEQGFAIIEQLDPETGVLPEFNQLYQTNSDIIGKLQIPGTKLDYPIVKGKDNLFYLNHTLYKEEHSLGIPFVDYRASFNPFYQSANVTIYGHSGADGSFFAPIKSYKDIEYYKNHPMIYFDTIYGQGKYKIIGLFMEDINPEHNKDFFNYHDFVDAQNENDVLDYVEKVMERSYFKTTVDVENTDQILSLSTCDTEVNKTDFRIVLVARKVRIGEDAEVDVVGATVNKDQIMPQLWIDKKGKKNIYQ